MTDPAGGARRREFRSRDGLRLSALDWPGPASATPLLCLSGIARTGLDFAGIAARHAGRRRVVALDYIGHGESEPAADPARYSLDQALADVMDAMAALHLHRVAWLGTSLGGILGMAMAVLRPGCLAAVVLNDIGPHLEPAGLDPMREVIGLDPGFATEAEAIGFLKARLPPLGFTEADWPGMVARSYARSDKDGRLHPRWDTRIAQAIGNGRAVPDLWPAFGALAEVPLLLVWGEESALLSLETVAAMRAVRPDMTLVALPGIGHAPPLNDPASLAALDAFLDAVP